MIFDITFRIPNFSKKNLFKYFRIILNNLVSKFSYNNNLKELNWNFSFLSESKGSINIFFFRVLFLLLLTLRRIDLDATLTCEQVLEGSLVEGRIWYSAGVLV